MNQIRGISSPAAATSKPGPTLLSFSRHKTFSSFYHNTQMPVVLKPPEQLGCILYNK
jgi:hypothetical protein